MLQREGLAYVRHETTEVEGEEPRQRFVVDVDRRIHSTTEPRIELPLARLEAEMDGLPSCVAATDLGRCSQGTERPVVSQIGTQPDGCIV
jgi:hypothetical protein